MIGSLPWYSTLIVIGAAIAVWLADREEKRAGLPKDTILDLALRVLPIGIIGARIYYVAFSWSSYREDPVSALYIWEGGLAIYGGLIAGFLCVLLFCKRRQLSLLTVCDTLIPGVALAQAIGRWGNYFNQEAYGLPLTNPAFQFFPLGVQIFEGGTPVWHMATFFYESISDFGIFLFLTVQRRKLLRGKGDVFYAYLFLYGAVRLIVENFRTDSLYAGGGVRISQLVSVLICGGILGMYFRRERTTRKAQGENRKGAANAILCAVNGTVLLLLLIYCMRQAWLPLGTIPLQIFFLCICSAIMVGTMVWLWFKSVTFHSTGDIGI